MVRMQNLSPIDWVSLYIAGKLKRVSDISYRLQTGSNLTCLEREKTLIKEGYLQFWLLNWPLRPAFAHHLFLHKHSCLVQSADPHPSSNISNNLNNMLLCLKAQRTNINYMHHGLRRGRHRPAAAIITTNRQGGVQSQWV